MASFWETIFGSPEQNYQLSNLTPQQQQMWNQGAQAMQGQGAGGAYGSVADYYRSLLAGDSQTEQAMAAPMMRQFNQDIVPGLAEQFAGMGSGGLSSSGFRNAGVQAGVDLQERLANIRAGLRQQGAAGLSGMYSQMLQPTMTNVQRPAEPGLFGNVMTGLGTAAGTALAGPLGGAVGAGLGGLWNSFRTQGNPNNQESIKYTGTASGRSLR